VKQRDNGESPLRGPYTFNIPITSLIEKGYVVSQKCLTNRYRSRWERGLVGEERLTTDTLGPQGMAAALLFAIPHVHGNCTGLDVFALVLNVNDYRAEIKTIAVGDLEWKTWITETAIFREFGNPGLPTSQRRSLKLGLPFPPVIGFGKRDNLEEEIYDVRFL